MEGTEKPSSSESTKLYRTLYVTHGCAVSEPELTGNHSEASFQSRENRRIVPNDWLAWFTYLHVSLTLYPDTIYLFVARIRHIAEAAISIRSKGHWSKV